VIFFTPFPVAPHEPISSANQKFKIKNPRVSASRPWRPWREPAPTPHAKSAKAATNNHSPSFTSSQNQISNIKNQKSLPSRPLRAKARPGTAGHEQSVLQSPITNLPSRPASAPRTLVGAWRPWREQSAFTLVELLAVIGIMGLLAAVGVPALKGLTGSGGRKQALSQVMGALEIARNTAISSGTNAAVIFPDQSFTNQAYRYRSMAVITWDATNTNSVTTNSMLGSWITLPQGVVLHDVQVNQLPRLANPTALQIPPSTSNSTVSNLRAIVFQSDGGLEERYYTNTLTLEGIAFYEGAVIPSSNPTATTNTSKQKTNVETITITHYTGRTIPTLAEPKK